jgi:glycosyltransferase involved in cell wall biosynthesis
MPVYNAEHRIRRALDSLLAQEFEDFELHISDNASTDNTAEVCKQYAARDPRIVCYRRERNHGQLANFDFVAGKARGKYFMWAADDDYWEPGFVGAMVRELEMHPEAGLAMCALRRVREDRSTLDVVRFSGNDDPARMTNLQVLLALAAGYANKKHYHLFMYGLFRASLISAASPYSRLQVPHPDRVFMCQFALGTRFRYVDDILLVRTVHDQPANVRMPEENFSRLINKGGWGQSRTVLAAGPYLVASPVVPWRRKLFVVLAVIGMAWAYRSVLYRGPVPLPLQLLVDTGRRMVRIFR